MQQVDANSEVERAKENLATAEAKLRDEQLAAKSPLQLLDELAAMIPMTANAVAIIMRYDRDSIVQRMLVVGDKIEELRHKLMAQGPSA